MTDDRYTWDAWDGEVCQECGSPYKTIYQVADKTWAKLSHGRNLLCPNCVEHHAHKLGLTLYWVASEDDKVVAKLRRFG